ncbi:MAG: hypothetical protein WA726_07160 [Acidimicrobiia bacterium]
MIESLETLLDLLTRPEFLFGLVVGCLALGLMYLVVTQGAQPGWWGLGVAAAAALVIELVGGRNLGLLIGWLALGAGGWLLTREDHIGFLGWLPVATGASIVGWRGVFDTRWVGLAAPIAIVAIGWALAMWSKRLPHTLIGPMFAITAFGIWVTVPETEMARILLGVSIPLALATLQPFGARLTSSGAFAVAGVMVWVVAVGGEQRGASIVGGWASIGALALLPFIQSGARRFLESRRWLALGLHAVLVFITARVIGLWTAPELATLAVCGLGALTYLGVGMFLTLDADAPVG